MFLLTNKALIWVGEGQKEKPIIITTWAVRVPIRKGRKDRFGKQFRETDRNLLLSKIRFWDCYKNNVTLKSTT